MTTPYKATYSPEDNKLRIYTEVHPTPETEKKLRRYGFIYAPIQKLFVSSKWTPARADLCCELAGEITQEPTTLLDRAEIKAKRVDKDRATAILLHAKQKTSRRARKSRIRRLYTKIRKYQKELHHAYVCIELWKKVQKEEDSERKTELFNYHIDRRIKLGETTPQCFNKSLSDQVCDQTLSQSQAIDICLHHHETKLGSKYSRRCITHLLNRIAYEREQLGERIIHEGPLSPEILQAFGREYGAHKPRIKKNGSTFLMVSALPLPECIADGKEISLTKNEWCLLMQDVGYHIPKQRTTSK